MLPEEVQEVLCRDGVKPNWSGTTNGKYNAEELSTDLKLLLECLKYHENNPEILKDGLLTVSSICLQNAEAQDYFRDSGGLNFVLNLLTANRHASIMESAMYTLGCATERNVFSQKQLCTKSVFRFLECKLVDRKSSSKLKRTIAYLLLCLVSNNSAAQTLINVSHCLDALLDIFRCKFPGYDPSPTSPGDTYFDKSAPADGPSLELWKDVTSSLIGCVNNPQNGDNQRECSSVFPVALNILSHSKDPQVIRLLASFLSLTADNNARNQDRLGMLGGMDIIVNALQTVVEALLQEPSPDCTDAAMQLASLLVSCVTENSWNKMTLADLRVVSLLVQLLALDIIEIEVKLKIVLTLGHLTEGCESSQRQLVESDGLGLIVHTMTGQQDEEFNKAATYLLHTCVRDVKSSDATGITEAHQPMPTIPNLKRKYVDNSRKQSTPIKKQQSTPIKKQQTKANRASANFRSETDEKSAKSVISEEDDSGSETPQEADLEVETETEKKEKPEPENGHTTVEALYHEINARKDLELKLQKEIQAREDVEAEKLKLEQKEKERVQAENVTKQKAEAIAKELERQYLKAANKQRSGTIDPETPKKTKEPNKETSKSTTTEQVAPITSPPSREVQILGKKVEELQKQLAEHLTHNKEQQSGFSSSASVISTQSVESKSTVAGQTSPLSSSASRRGKAKRCGSQTFQLSKDRQAVYAGESLDPEIRKKDMKSPRRSHRSDTRMSEEEITGSKSASIERRRSTPNLRRSTKPQAPETIFKLPSSTITRSQKTLKRNQNSSQSGSQKVNNTSENKKRSPVSRATYAEEVLPYKQNKYGSPLVLPKHRIASSTSNDDESDVESIITDLTDSQSVADSCVSWSDVLLKLPVRPKRSRAHRNRRKSRQRDEKSSSICSSQSMKSRRSFVIHSSISEVPFSSPTTSSSTKSILNCPGCDPPVHRPLLTSRNFLYTLEKSRHTCPEHREIQKVIKQDIENRKKLQGRKLPGRASKKSDTGNRSVYSFETETPVKRAASHTNWISSDSLMDTKREQEHTPRSTRSSTSISDVCDRPRRKRQEFSQEEIDNLISGVKKSGKHWNFILWSYKFKPGRTAVDLKDKYRRMQESDHESIITDLSDSQSVEESWVSWSDVLLKLPVHPKRANTHRNQRRSRQLDEKSSSICSSQSRKSRRSFVIKHTDSQVKSKGCDPPVHRPLLTSRNFLYTLEKSRHTCPEHREIQKLIKHDIENRKKLQGRKLPGQASKKSDTGNESIYSFETETPVKRAASHTNWISSDSLMEMNREQEQTPRSTRSSTSIADVCDRPRRKRQEFSQEEIDNLISGVKKSGKHWNFILWSYKFKPGRTAPGVLQLI